MPAATLSRVTPYHSTTSGNSLSRWSIAEQDQATLFFWRHKLRRVFAGCFIQLITSIAAAHGRSLPCVLPGTRSMPYLQMIELSD